MTNIIRSSQKNPAYTPDQKTLRKIAKAAKVTVLWLEHGDDEVAAVDAAPRGVRAPDQGPPPEGTPLERALSVAFKAGDYLPSDMRAVEDALPEFFRKELNDDGADLVEAADHWLRAAKALRVAGERVTTEALLFRVSVGKTQRARLLDEETSERMTQDMHAKALEEGVQVGSGRALLDAAAEKQRRKSERDS